MITKKQRILLLLAAGYALALTGWTAGGTLLRPQRVRVEEKPMVNEKSSAVGVNTT